MDHPQKTNEIVLPDSESAAEKVTVTLWRSRTGRMYLLESERVARWDGATHVYCEDCGAPTEKGTFTVCPVCKERRDTERWKAMPRRPWDGRSPICIMGSDQHFFHEDDLGDYCADHDCEPDDLLLVHCVRMEPHHLEAGDWFDRFIPENEDASCLPQPILDAVDRLNEAISTSPPLAWRQGKEAVLLQDPKETEMDGYVDMQATTVRCALCGAEKEIDPCGPKPLFKDSGREFAYRLPLGWSYCERRTPDVHDSDVILFTGSFVVCPTCQRLFSDF